MLTHISTSFLASQHSPFLIHTWPFTGSVWNSLFLGLAVPCSVAVFCNSNLLMLAPRSVASSSALLSVVTNGLFETTFFFFFKFSWRQNFCFVLAVFKGDSGCHIETLDETEPQLARHSLSPSLAPHVAHKAAQPGCNLFATNPSILPSFSILC